MFITGFIGFAILCGLAVTSTFNVNGSHNYMDIWQLFGITPISNGFFILGIIGIIIALFGVFQKEK